MYADKTVMKLNVIHGYRQPVDTDKLHELKQQQFLNNQANSFQTLSIILVKSNQFLFPDQDVNKINNNQHN